MNSAVSLNQEQAATYAPPAHCTYPDCTAPATLRIYWRATRDDPVLRTAPSCAGHQRYLENQAHVVAVEVQQ